MSIAATSTIQIERLADLVRSQHPSLKTMWLEPDGRYQTRTLGIDVLMRELRQCLAAGFADRRAADFPMLYFAWGKCRVGSTPLTNLFGSTGMPSYYQPLKTMLRHSFVGSAVTPWIVPSAADTPHMFSKETAGPYVLAESLFNPLQVLIEAGYPADRLHVIMLDREPASSLASWLDKWSGRVPDSMLLRNYIIAALNKGRVESCARQHGVPITHYVYEASREAAQSVRILFDRLGLAARFTEDAVTDWRETGQLNSASSRITFGVEPPIYHLADLHGSDIAYRYRPRATASLSEQQLDLLDRCGVNDVYRASVAACVRDLGLGSATAERLFGHMTGVPA